MYFYLDSLFRNVFIEEAVLSSSIESKDIKWLPVSSLGSASGVSEKPLHNDIFGWD